MTQPGGSYFTNPLGTPDELREFAKDALVMSRTLNVMPAATTRGPGITYTEYPDNRLSAITAVLQGMLAMQLADSITHVITEEP